MTKEWLDQLATKTESVNIAGGEAGVQAGQEIGERNEAAGFRRGSQAAFGEASAKPKQPGFGFMKGLLMIEPGYDLTTPSSELWFEGVVRKTDRNG